LAKSPSCGTPYNFCQLNEIAMKTLAQRILARAAELPEGTPLTAKELLHMGSRAALDQALGRLVQRSSLLRAGRGALMDRG
jgi:hypothetical protein